MQILSLAADIKVPEKSPIQILEIMPAHLAGETGYRTGEGEMTQEHVMPWLETLAGDDPVVMAEKLVPLDHLGRHYGFEVAEKGRGVIYPKRAVAHGNLRLGREDFLFAEENPAYVVVNAYPVFNAAAENKAAQALILGEIKDRQVTKAFAPGMLLMAEHDAEKTGKIYKRLGVHDHYIVKPVDQSQGNGVRIVPADDLDRTLENLLKKKESSGFAGMAEALYSAGILKTPWRHDYTPALGKDYWQTAINPVLMVQPYIASAPVEADGAMYDGTLRVFMTAHRASAADDFSLKIHDGYWKLPARPLQKARERESAISFSPHRPESQGRLARIFNRFSRAPHRIMSLPLTEEAAQPVFTQLGHVMPAFLKAVMAVPLHERIQNWLASPFPEARATATMLAVDPETYPAGDDATIHRNFQAFSPLVADRLLHGVQKNPDNPLSFFLCNLKNDRNRHIPDAVDEAVLAPAQIMRQSDAIFRWMMPYLKI